MEKITKRLMENPGVLIPIYKDSEGYIVTPEMPDYTLLDLRR